MPPAPPRQSNGPLQGSVPRSTPGAQLYDRHQTSQLVSRSRGSGRVLQGQHGNAQGQDPQHFSWSTAVYAAPKGEDGGSQPQQVSGFWGVPFCVARRFCGIPCFGANCTMEEAFGDSMGQDMVTIRVEEAFLCELTPHCPLPFSLLRPSLHPSPLPPAPLHFFGNLRSLFSCFRGMWHSRLHRPSALCGSLTQVLFHNPRKSRSRSSCSRAPSRSKRMRSFWRLCSRGR